MVCDTFSLKSKDDEVIVSQTIERIICDKGKGFVAWLKKGKLSVEPGVLVQSLTNPSRGFQETNSFVPDSAGYSLSSNVDKSQSDASKRNPTKSEPGHGYHLPHVHRPSLHTSVKVKQRQYGSVKLRSLLRYGNISVQPEDLQIWDPQFSAPDCLTKTLFEQYRNVPVTGITITRGTDGTLRWSVDPKLIEVSRSKLEGIQIAGNESLVLKTRIYKGLVSLDESDVHYRFGKWEIPQHIVESLKVEYCATPCGELYIISDGK